MNKVHIDNNCTRLFRDKKSNMQGKVEIQTMAKRMRSLLAISLANRSLGYEEEKQAKWLFHHGQNHMMWTGGKANCCLTC